MDDEYISLDVLASRLSLPRRFLRESAAAGKIPSLNIKGRLRFEETAVREALRAMAEARAQKLAEVRTGGAA